MPGELQGAIEDALRSCWEDSGDAKVRVWEGHARSPKPGIELTSHFGCTPVYSGEGSWIDNAPDSAVSTVILR